MSDENLNPIEPETASSKDEGVAAAPADILRRVEALDEKDEAEKLARAEEERLAARRAGAPGLATGSEALEAAATRKLEAIGTKLKKKKLAKEQVGVSEGSDADGIYEQEEVKIEPLHDPFLDGSRSAMDWIKAHTGIVWAGVGIGVLAIVGFAVAKQMAASTEAKASELFASALEVNSAPVTTTPPEDTDIKTYPTVAARRDAALEKFAAVTKEFPNTGAAILARLSEASLLADKGDNDAAIKDYDEVRRSALAVADARVKAQATEGAAQAHEAKGDNDGAMALYKELEGLSAAGAKESGQYNQARLLEKKGDKEGAKALYLKARESMAKNKAFAYLSTAVDDHLRGIDPSLVPTKPAGGMGGLPGMPGGLPPGMDPSELESLLGGQGAP